MSRYTFAKITDELDEVNLTSFRSTKKNIKLNASDFQKKLTSIKEFSILNKIGQGTYGIVYKAKKSKNNKIYALKEIIFNENSCCGLPIFCLREINLLKQLNHKNIVSLIDVVVGVGIKKIFLVFEYCIHDLAKLIDNMPVPFTESQIKCILFQLLHAVEFLHDHFIIHRDIKLSNILLDAFGTIKLADFGMARKFEVPYKPMTPIVVTLWYRAPELLLGSEKHTTAIDMWAIGCVMAELFLSKPLLPGNSEIEQIQLIIDLLGTPNDQIWQGFSNLPGLKNIKLKKQPYNNIRSKFPWMCNEGIEFMQDLFVYDPSLRSTAVKCLDDIYFKTQPLAIDKEFLPTFPETINKRQKKN